MDGKDKLVVLFIFSIMFLYALVLVFYSSEQKNVDGISGMAVLGSVPSTNVVGSSNLVGSSSVPVNKVVSQNFEYIQGSNSFLSTNDLNDKIGAKTGTNSKFDNAELLFDGYLVEFVEEPVIVRENKLRADARKMKSVQTVVDVKAPLSADVSSAVKSYSTSVKSNNEKIKSAILSDVNSFRKSKVSSKSPSAVGVASQAVSSTLKIDKEFTTVFNGVSVHISPEEAERVKKIPGVKSVVPNYIVHATLMDSVPMINADDVWKLDWNGNSCSVSKKYCLTGEGVTIGIIDTGIDYTHPDLGGCTQAQFLSKTCFKVVGGYDFVNYDVNPIDDHGHGTHVAATAAGKGVLKGVAPDAKLYAFKVLDSGGSGSWSGIIEAIARATDLDNDGIPMEDKNDYVDIISLSLGGPGNPDDEVSLAIDSVVDAGVVAVIAAGNDGPLYHTIGSPGTSRKAITVGAVDKNNKIAYFSSRGPVIWTGTDGLEKSLIKPDVTAPGVSICAAQWADAWSDRRCLDGKHVALDGTSMATPHVAGVVALLKQKNPDWTPLEIKNSLKYSAKANANYNSNVQGYGSVDALSLINLNNSINTVWDFAVTSPFEYLMETNKSFEIKGIFPENYESLKVRYHNESNFNWSSTGITIVGINSTIAIVSSIVSAKGGKYTFEIEIKKDGIIKKETISYSFDNSLMKGNPIKISAFQAYMDFPLLEDLNNDSIDELIFSTYPEGKIYVINSDLENLPGWPKQIGEFGSDIPPGGRPTIADLDNDGVKDIVIVSGYSAAGTPGYLLNSYVYAFYLNGSSFKGFPVTIELSEPLFLSTIYDLNNDGKQEMIVVTGAIVANTLTNEWFDNRKIYVISNKGEFLINWPVETKNNLRPITSASITDLDNDGKSEIIVGTFNYSGGYDGLADMESFYFNGSMVKGFPKQLGMVYGVTSEDLNDDGFTEIITNSRDSNGGVILSVFSYMNNSFKEYCNNHQYSESVVIGDINRDSKLEIISVNGADISVLNYTCGMLPGWPKRTTGYVMRQAIVADIEGDANEEVLVVGQDGGVFAFNFKGERTPGFPKYIDGLGRDLTVGNFDSDNFVELIVTSMVDGEGNIYVFNLNSIYNKSMMSWPQYMHDSQHTGCYDCDKVKTNICNDSDVGVKENFVRGNVSLNGVLKGVDSCSGSFAVKEFFCNMSSVPAFRIDDCPEMWSCVDGACVGPSCVNSDAGAGEYFVKGSILWNGKLAGVDSCYFGTFLKEYYCTTGNMTTYTYKNCLSFGSNYGCVDGACRLPAPVCRDSDGGLNINVKGTLNSSNLGVKVDVCNASSSPYTLVEYYCNGSTGVGVASYCSYGCSNGACIVPTPVCRDSDGGFNITVKGNASNGSVTKVDVCATSTVVSEAICSGNVPVYSTTGCATGFICSNGACLKNTTTKSTGGGTFV